ncbi:hypothetical protein PAAG_07691 [Paracoccidioides lutzii Pb01]|uniref:Uncharacterized protein n=1 Tax=Paracoccidioides lutzii (strain ATCC MYA-826 / Pb01) TaxID=502779 RepID=C1HAN7_PARBA|nr:hypothetical protein PAAG_07691 [Paracoccidioides lutzii Pb01]EEH37410.2 hypothetical protein PAAG_07691 [Paracoccidioides lutzii Pb01]
MGRSRFSTSHSTREAPKYTTIDIQSSAGAIASSALLRGARRGGAANGDVAVLQMCASLVHSGLKLKLRKWAKISTLTCFALKRATKNDVIQIQDTSGMQQELPLVHASSWKSMQLITGSTKQFLVGEPPRTGLWQRGPKDGDP